MVFMPTGDLAGYPQGHFSRVYQYIIVPACKSAGFSPVRADDPASNGTPLDIVKNIIESDIAVCDLSSKSQAALYAFAIRQAVGLPVAIMKDLKTEMMFNVQEFGAVEFDESLRIDTVQKEIEALSTTLEKAYASKAVTSALLSRIGIGTEKQDAPVVAEPVVQENPREKESHLPLITPVPDFVGDPVTQPEEIDKLKEGDFLFHVNYGKGEIKSMNRMSKDKIVKIQFDSGTKLLVLGTSGVFRKIKGQG